MKIVISSKTPRLDGDIDPRFGRCGYLLFIDTETMHSEVVENPGAGSGGGAGVATSQAVVARAVDAILTGDVGPNAYRVLSEAGVKVISGVSGKVADAVEAYKKGTLKETSGPTAGMGAR